MPHAKQAWIESEEGHFEKGFSKTTMSPILMTVGLDLAVTQEWLKNQHAPGTKGSLCPHHSDHGQEQRGITLRITRTRSLSIALPRCLGAPDVLVVASPPTQEEGAALQKSNVGSRPPMAHAQSH